MKWETAINNKNTWIAHGDLGDFIIKKVGRTYYPKFVGEKTFNLPPQRTIKLAKEICQNNWYWED